MYTIDIHNKKLIMIGTKPTKARPSERAVFLVAYESNSTYNHNLRFIRLQHATTSVLLHFANAMMLWIKPFHLTLRFTANKTNTLYHISFASLPRL